ncbi:MAG: bifunctional glutamate N-acetyltransferase/amino-acid acetyltransferase ArgJ [Capsulimonadaceae bacterium]|nr:bifunctional glutamate N-acetyltransferase/amino-acid acetyltransferase ArgJ [Capsulimonadaceae bacterium]
MAKFTTIEGGVVAAKGFRCAGAHAGIKRKRNDVALIVSDVDAVAAGVFTQNVVRAHCVIANERRILGGVARAIVCNSGNANACNGEDGASDDARMASLVAERIGCNADHVLTASTGVIGVALPLDRIEKGIEATCASLQSANSDGAAEGIMTTDTYPKAFAVEVELSGGHTVRIGAIAKGSGMIAPNMATMLCFVTTDADIERDTLQAMLSRCSWYTFNSVSVDGDTSTNDSVLVLANGQAGNTKIASAASADGAAFETALYNVCLHLAKEIARDGEGATKLVEVVVRGVAPPGNLVRTWEANDKTLSPEQRASFARSVAKTVANSNLVKTALFGNDPNWGRILAAVGRSGVKFEPSAVEITLAGHKVYASGQPTKFNGYVVSEALKAKEVTIEIDLHQDGGEQATVWTCDFSYDYVKINAEYHT